VPAAEAKGKEEETDEYDQLVDIEDTTDDNGDHDYDHYPAVIVPTSIRTNITTASTGTSTAPEPVPLLSPTPHCTTTTTTTGTKVKFAWVQVREYAITIGDNPFCSSGAPIALDWDYTDTDIVDVDVFEMHHKRQRHSRRRMLLSPTQRRVLLWRNGHNVQDIDQAAKQNEKEKFRQHLNLFFLPIHMVQEFLATQSEKWWYYRTRRTQGDVQCIEEKVRQLHQRQLASVDTENGGLPPWQQHHHPPVQQEDSPTTPPPTGTDDGNSSGPRKMERRISFRKSASAGQIMVHSGSVSSFQSEVSALDMSSDEVHPSSSPSAGDAAGAAIVMEDDLSTCSTASRFTTYTIRTDPRQHDKATEIILCSLERPHMRAFHASWFGFFIGFIMWFAITPLLGEVKETLGLTNAQIWMSSLAGTTVTVLARIMMGPLCDMFGARRCMAVVVIISAIPCGLTGLVHTATGLSVVRALVGIGGSAFVPCQYWTSRMFAREVRIHLPPKC
jgi:hypothetical protein